MSDTLYRHSVLMLSKHWLCAATATPVKAFGMMSSGVGVGIDIDVEGGMNPTKWEDWLSLPVREHDEAIHSANLTLRVPTVIIAVNYDKLHLRSVPFSGNAVRHRDKYTCQYCGNVFESRDLNLDHVVPREQKGQTTWENIVASCYKCNGRKANKLIHEVGMHLLRKPFSPRPLPPSKHIQNRYGLKDWDHFLA